MIEVFISWILSLTPSGEGGCFLIFLLFKSILFFVNWISLYLFQFFWNITIIMFIRGRVYYSSIFNCSIPCFLSIKFHCTLLYLIKYYHIMFINIAFWLGCDWPSALLFFMPTLLLSTLTPLFLHFVSVSLFYFIIAVRMRECLGKHSCMRYTFPIAKLNSTCFFRSEKLEIVKHL